MTDLTWTQALLLTCIAALAFGRALYLWLDGR